MFSLPWLLDVNKMKFTGTFNIGVSDEKPLVRSADPIALAGGAGAVIIALVAMLLLPMISEARQKEDTSKVDSPPFEYIEARLLKFGEVKDDTKLPDRIVPALPTAPGEVLSLDMDENRPEPKIEEDKPERQADAVTDDKLREVFDKARAFAEIQDDYIPEGHPDGVPDGDVTDPALASLGATYGHRIKRFFLDRWIVPTLLSEGALRDLKVKVNIKVDIDVMIVSTTFLRKSGNRMFDDSVQNAIDRVIKEVRNLPTPPEAIAARVFGSGINLTFNGREASYE